MRERHCSDETLVALLDSELGPGAKRIAEAHLAVCWPCRTRAAELEQQIHLLSKSLADETYPGPDWILDSRERFAQARRRIDLETRDRASSFLGRMALWKPALAAACLVVLLTAGWFSMAHRVESPRALVNRIVSEERTGFAAPVHVVYDVRIVPVKPAGVARTSTIEYWSDRPSDRFCWRWLDTSGKLTHAVWQSGAAKQYAFDAASTTAEIVPAGRTSSPVDLSDLSFSEADPEQVAGAFLQWLLSRKWQPVSFAADMGSFVSADGVELNIEQLRSEQGKPTLRLTAERSLGQKTARLTVDLDPVSYRPTVQRVRLEHNGRTVDLILSTRHIDFAPAGRFVAAVFEPDVPIRGARAIGPVSGVRAGEGISSLSAPVVPEGDTPRREIEVLFLLHQLKACEGNPLEVLPAPSGRLLVRGVVLEDSRKQDLVARLLQLPSSAQLDLQIQSSADLLKSATPASAAAEVAPNATLKPIAGGTMAIEAQLRKYLADDRGAPPENLDAQASLFTGRVLSASNALLAQSGELRRLVEKRGQQQLDLHSRELLDSIIHDHLASLKQRNAELKALVEPLLHGVAGVAMGSQKSSAPEPRTDLNHLILSSFQAARQVHDDVRVLFGGLSGSDSAESIQLTAKRILRLLDQLHGGLQPSEALFM